MQDTIRTLTTAGVGEAAIITTDVAIPHETIQIVLQVIIGIVTLVKLLKPDSKKRK
jgi:hypothetical protein